MASFGHAIRPLSRAELAMQERYPVTCRYKRVRPGHNACGRQSTHVASFDYDGSAGVIQTATLRVCGDHAREFTIAHRLRMPRVPAEELR